MIRSSSLTDSVCLISAIMLHFVVFFLILLHVPLSFVGKQEEKLFSKNEADIIFPHNYLMAKKTILKRQDLSAGEGDQKNRSLLKYQDAIKQKIQRSKIYPRWALRVKHQGTVRLSFKVEKNGRARDLVVLKKTPFAELNREALNAIIRAQPFESLPQNLGRNYIEIRMDMVFRINTK